MATPVIIIGRSGTGKSTSLRNFTKNEVGIINVLGKPLPFRNDLPSVSTTSYGQIHNIIKTSKVNAIVIDDAGYLITDMFMTRHSDTKDTYGLFNDLGDSFYKLIRFISQLPDSADKIVYIMMHEDADDMGRYKVKTIGKLLDEKVTIEGMVSILLRSIYRDGQYLFQTNGDGIVKTPPEMFDDEYIENDLKAVDSAIREYYNLAPIVPTDKKQEKTKADKAE